MTLKEYILNCLNQSLVKEGKIAFKIILDSGNWFFYNQEYYSVKQFIDQSGLFDRGAPLCGLQIGLDICMSRIEKDHSGIIILVFESI